MKIEIFRGNKINNIIKKILIILLLLTLIFYSFMFWKLSRTSNQFLTLERKLTIIFTWSPTKISYHINNIFDSIYLKDKNTIPVTSFTELKDTIEQVIKKPIIFSEFTNKITFNENGESVINKGQFLIEKNGNYIEYKFFLYKNKTIAKDTTELNHPQGLVIYKEPYKISYEKVQRSAIFTSAGLKVEKILSEDNIDKNNLTISMENFIGVENVNSMSIGYKYGDDYMFNDRRIIFSENGNVIKDTIIDKSENIKK